MNTEINSGNLGETNFNSTMRVIVLMPYLLIIIRLKLSIGNGERTPSPNSHSEISVSILITPKEYSKFEGIQAENPFSTKNVDFKHKLPLVMESNVILIFLNPAGLILVMPVKLIEKNLAALIGCHLLKFLSISMHSTRIQK